MLPTYLPQEEGFLNVGWNRSGKWKPWREELSGRRERPSGFSLGSLVCLYKSCLVKSCLGYSPNSDGGMYPPPHDSGSPWLRWQSRNCWKHTSLCVVVGSSRNDVLLIGMFFGVITFRSISIKRRVPAPLLRIGRAVICNGKSAV